MIEEIATALPLARADSPAMHTEPMRVRPVQELVAGLTERYTGVWDETSSDPCGSAQLGPEIGYRKKWRNRFRVKRLISRLCREVPRAPEASEGRARWESRLKALICDFGESCLGWPASFREAALAEEIFRGTLEFSRRYRDLERRSGIEVEPGGLFQALRNVWIMNGLQVLLARPVATTSSVFAYSMLYPLTDNLLDDPNLPRAAKEAFNERLGRRLAGGRPPAENGRERVVFELVGAIEEEFPRERYPQVFESLLAIHRGQVRSLGQQAPPQGGAGGQDGPERWLLRVSVEKGGTSVLADGFLVAGDIAAETADFLFGYGVVLQLLDDLQDATADCAAGHRTVFSIAAGRRSLDDSASRLARLTARVLLSAERFPTPGWSLVVELIRRSCPLLLLQAVADQQGLFSPGYVRRMARHFPVRFASLPGLRRRTERRWARTERALLRRRGADSMKELWEPACASR